MSNFISINDEIVKNLRQRQTHLNEDMRILNEDINSFCNEFQYKCIEDIRKAEDIVCWLKEVTVGTKLLQNYFNNFPSVKLPLNEYISDKIEEINDDPVDMELFKRISTVAILATQLNSLKKI